jgi:hypothetical protein
MSKGRKNDKRGGRRRTTWTKETRPRSPGRPKLPADYKAALEDMGPRGMQALQNILDNPDHPRHEQAAEYIVNRWKGTPTVKVESSGPNGGPIPVALATTSGAKRARAVALLEAAAARIAEAQAKAAAGEGAASDED